MHFSEYIQAHRGELAGPDGRHCVTQSRSEKARDLKVIRVNNPGQLRVWKRDKVEACTSRLGWRKYRNESKGVQDRSETNQFVWIKYSGNKQKNRRLQNLRC